MKKILVIGSSNVDMIIRTNKFPQPGQTVIGNSLIKSLGGKGANQAVACSLTGADVTFLTALGNDDNKNFVLNELNKYNLTVKPIIKNTNTGLAIITVEEISSENEIVVEGGANLLFDIKDIDDNINLIKAADYILLQLELDLKVIEYIIKKAKDLNKIVILNPAPYKELSDYIINNIDYITPNEGELKSITNFYSNSYQENSRLLHNKGVNNVIVTLGSNGSYLLNNKKEIAIKGLKVSAIDTTGAGDCYNGVFVGYMAQNYSLEDSLNKATIASAISVTRPGTAISYPTKDEINNYK